MPASLLEEIQENEIEKTEVKEKNEPEKKEKEFEIIETKKNKNEEKKDEIEENLKEEKTEKEILTVEKQTQVEELTEMVKTENVNMVELKVGGAKNQSDTEIKVHNIVFENKNPDKNILLERAYKKGNYLNENFNDVWGKSQKIYFKDAPVIEPQTESTKMFQKLMKNIDKVGVLNKSKWKKKEAELKTKENDSTGFFQKVIKVLSGNMNDQTLSKYSRKLLDQKRNKVMEKEYQQKQYENSATFSLFRSLKN
jgi:hypothetical protein